MRVNIFLRSSAPVLEQRAVWENCVFLYRQSSIHVANKGCHVRHWTNYVSWNAGSQFIVVVQLLEFFQIADSQMYSNWRYFRIANEKRFQASTADAGVLTSWEATKQRNAQVCDCQAIRNA